MTQQTACDLRAAGEREPSVESPSYPFKRTPADDVIERAKQRPMTQAEKTQREFEHMRAA